MRLPQRAILGCLCLSASHNSLPPRLRPPQLFVSGFAVVPSCGGRRIVGDMGFSWSASKAVGGGCGNGLDLYRRRSGGARQGRATAGLSMRLPYKRRRMQNQAGDFFVDESCVDCDICRWMDPRTFKRFGLGSIVESQPTTKEERLEAFKAMLACPSGSIRVLRGDKLVLEAMDSFPIPVDPERLPGVYQMAPTTKESMGVTPYLIVRPEGNILIDVPRFLRKTAAKVEALGGVKYLIVTARDNAFGHERWKERFPDLIRILHRTDLARRTRVMEERLDEGGPWHLVKHGRGSAANGWVTGATARFDFVNPETKKRRAAKDKAVKIIGATGVTRGSVMVIYDLERPDGGKERIGFSGGAVGYSSYLQKLDTFAERQEESKADREASVRRLAKEGITALLPGRGAKVMFQNSEESRKELEEAAARISEFKDFSSHPLLGLSKL